MKTWTAYSTGFCEVQMGSFNTCAHTWPWTLGALHQSSPEKLSLGICVQLKPKPDLHQYNLKKKQKTFLPPKLGVSNTSIHLKPRQMGLLTSAPVKWRNSEPSWFRLGDSKISPPNKKRHQKNFQILKTTYLQWVKFSVRWEVYFLLKGFEWICFFLFLFFAIRSNPNTLCQQICFRTDWKWMFCIFMSLSWIFTKHSMSNMTQHTQTVEIKLYRVEQI